MYLKRLAYRFCIASAERKYREICPLGNCCKADRKLIREKSILVNIRPPFYREQSEVYRLIAIYDLNLERIEVAFKLQINNIAGLPFLFIMDASLKRSQLLPQPI